LVALALATGSFYWRLFPLIRKLDRNGQIQPQNYSMLLGTLIFAFIAFFIVAAII